MAKSAANVCKLRQWRSQQPSCLAYVVLDDRLPVMTGIDCNIIFERSVAATEKSLLAQLKQPATQILTALLLQQRRWDRPLGTAHFATVKCQLIQHFATIQVTKSAIGSVRWMQRFSSLWPDLLDIRRVAITLSCSNQESMPFSKFGTVDCQRVIVRFCQVPISTASQQFCLWLSCFEYCQPVCPGTDPKPNPITGDALLQIIASTEIQAPGR